VPDNLASMKVPPPIIEGAMQAGSGRTQGIDALDIRHYLRVVWKRKWLIVARVGELLARETAAGLRRLERYHEFAEQVRETKRALLDFLIATTRKGQTIVGYGASAKGNTLLNYCGVRTDLIAYMVDRSPHKQGMFLPGTRIPIHAPERGRFVVPVPRVEVYA
jgi:C-methyltransferase C-terminal domain